MIENTFWIMLGLVVLSPVILLILLITVIRRRVRVSDRVYLKTYFPTEYAEKYGNRRHRPTGNHIPKEFYENY